MKKAFNSRKFRTHVSRELMHLPFPPADSDRDDAVYRYLVGLAVVAGNQLKDHTIKKEVVALVRCRFMPYLDLSAMQWLLERRRFNPGVIQNLLTFVKTLGIRFDSFSSLRKAFNLFDSKESAESFTARMILLRTILDKSASLAIDFERPEFVDLLRTVGVFHIDKEVAEVIVTGIEHFPEHRINTLFFWMDEVRSRENVEEAFMQVFSFCHGVLRELPGGDHTKLHPRHCTYPNLLNYTPEFRRFIELMSKRMNGHIPHVLDRLGFENLYCLYLLNPNLYKQLAPQAERWTGSYEFFMAYMNEIQMNHSLANGYWNRTLTTKEFQWFRCLYQGKGLIGRKDLPVTLTRKAVHRFRKLNANLGFTIRQQLVLAQVLQKGVDDLGYASQIVNGMGSRRQADYLIDAMHDLFGRGLPAREVRYMMDYLKAKFDTARVNVKGKQRATLIRDAERWHDHINMLRDARWGDFDYHWYGSADFKLSDSGIEDHLFDHAEVNYKAVQLRRAKELLSEGETMNHCVASYVKYCKSGNTFIFSLREITDKGEQRLLTLEVQGRRLVQALGFCNRRPKESEMDVIRLWASYAGVQLRL